MADPTHPPPTQPDDVLARLRARMVKLDERWAEIERLRARVDGLNPTIRQPDAPQTERWEYDSVSGPPVGLHAKADYLAAAGYTEMTAGYCDQNGTHWLWFRRRATP